MGFAIRHVMKPRHAAALALVGWYLMIPPRPSRNGWFPNWERTIANLSGWDIIASFDSAQACEAARSKASSPPSEDVQKFLKKYSANDPSKPVPDVEARRIATDDPRLAK